MERIKLTQEYKVLQEKLYNEHRKDGNKEYNSFVELISKMVAKGLQLQEEINSNN